MSSHHIVWVDSENATCISFLRITKNMHHICSESILISRKIKLNSDKWSIGLGNILKDISNYLLIYLKLIYICILALIYKYIMYLEYIYQMSNIPLVCWDIVNNPKE